MARFAFVIQRGLSGRIKSGGPASIAIPGSLGHNVSKGRVPRGPLLIHSGQHGHEGIGIVIFEHCFLVLMAGAAFIERNRQWIRWKHVKVLLAIARCRTTALGGHVVHYLTRSARRTSGFVLADHPPQSRNDLSAAVRFSGRVIHKSPQILC
jgi:hypothetical protein